MSALLWLAAAIILITGEMLTGDLVMAMLAGGALVAGGVDLIADPPLWITGLVFGVVSILLLGVVRPVAKRHLLSRPKLLTNTEALEGKPAHVTIRVDDHSGRVSINGDEWSARAMNPGDVFEPGAQVSVMQIDGATAVVWRG